MTNLIVGQRVRVMNAISTTFATVTSIDEQYIYAKLDEGGPAYSYLPEMLEAASEEAIETHYKQVAVRQAYLAKLTQEQAPIQVPASFQANADWLCQECGHSWNGTNGQECPHCGERSMIVSPKGR